MTDNACECAKALARELDVPEWAGIEIAEELERFKNPNAPVRSWLCLRRARVQCSFNGGFQCGRLDQFRLGTLDIGTHEKFAQFNEAVQAFGDNLT